MNYLNLFFTFFKIGLFTFGGGYAMIPLIQSEVLGKGWLTSEQLINFIAVSESTPGPFAINIATFIGTIKGGLLGAVSATLGVVMPSFIIILIVAKCYEKFKTNKIVKGCMTGLKPAVAGLIGSALISLGKTVFFQNGINLALFTDKNFYLSLFIFILSVLLVFKKKLHPIGIICISAVLGIIFGYCF